MNWKKRVISLTLSACVLFGNIPAMAFATKQQAAVENQDSASVPFTDVDMNSWYGDAVQYVYKHQLMSGTSKTTFEPYTVMSRAMVAQILYNQSGKPEISSGYSGFSDVSENDWFYTAVKWARENGYASGVGNNKFAPNDDVTREQFAQFLYNYAGQPKVQGDDLSKFPDGNSVSWSKDAMTWAVQNKIINGMQKDYGGLIRLWLMPHDKATRAQAATIIGSFYIKAVKPENTVASGLCGKNVSWALDKSGVLYIKGMGDMEDNFSLDSPWNKVASKVKRAIIEESVTSICEGAFSGCKKMKNITIPNHIVSIGDYAFSDCQSLENIEVPDSVTRIGKGAFSGCTNLLSIRIPEELTMISAGEFSRCESLKNFEISNRVTKIGDSAFSGCSSLTDMIIPDSINTIGDDAFSGCNSLTDMIIPDSINAIGNGTFSMCNNLKNVKIPDSVTSIGEAAFYECASLKNIAIPDSVEEMGRYAFAYSALTDIRLPTNLTDLEDGVFYACHNLTNIEISQNITSIGEKAFGHSGLTNVEIPASVTEIGQSTFKECPNLSYVKISNGVLELSEWMFAGCEKLTDIEIPDSVTKIGKLAFYDCNALADVHYKGTKEQWEAIVLGESNEPLLSANIHYNS